MINANFTETKHKLTDIITDKQASTNVVALFEDVLNQIDAKLKAQGKTVYFTTQKNGATGFCRPGKAFAWIDMTKNFVSILLFTGHSNIPGLAKANWVNKNDNLGSERVRVQDHTSLQAAVDWACGAFDIALRF